MIKTDDLYFSYNSNLILEKVSLQVLPGEFVGIIGSNGAGKSTLLKLLDRIIQPDSGKIFIFDRNLESYSRRSLAKLIGFVPQLFSTAFNFTALEIVLMGRFPYQKFFGYETRTDIEIVEKSMYLTDCYSLRNRSFLKLSAGEQKRVVLASSLAQEPKILLLDEPTTTLDLNHQVHFYKILKKLQVKEGLTILMVTHDLNFAGQFCDRIVALKNGKIIADNLVNNVFIKPVLEEIYNTPLEVMKHPRTGIPLILPELGKE
jgi:iron complex transport system ATP-binding protein